MSTVAPAEYINDYYKQLKKIRSDDEEDYIDTVFKEQGDIKKAFSIITIIAIYIIGVIVYFSIANYKKANLLPLAHPIFYPEICSTVVVFLCYFITSYNGPYAYTPLLIVGINFLILDLILALNPIIRKSFIFPFIGTDNKIKIIIDIIWWSILFPFLKVLILSTLYHYFFEPIISPNSPLVQNKNMLYCLNELLDKIGDKKKDLILINYYKDLIEPEYRPTIDCTAISISDIKNTFKNMEFYINIRLYTSYSKENLSSFNYLYVFSIIIPFTISNYSSILLFIGTLGSFILYIIFPEKCSLPIPYKHLVHSKFNLDEMDLMIKEVNQNIERLCNEMEDNTEQKPQETIKNTTIKKYCAAKEEKWKND